VTFADIAATFGFKFSQNNGFELEAEAALVFAVLDSLLDPAKWVAAFVFNCMGRRPL